MEILNKNQMFNTLPKKSRGFTLIELMVAISIVAILAVVGLTVFTNTQKNARDTKRRGDIDAIANALGNKKVPGDIYYTTLVNGDFVGNAIPSDPKSTASSGAQDYCLFGLATVPPAAVTPPAAGTNWTTCASSGIAGVLPYVVKAGVSDTPLDTVKITSWAICLKTEATSKIECKYSQ